jgi:hypothetical protein
MPHHFMRHRPDPEHPTRRAFADGRSDVKRKLTSISSRAALPQ